MVLNLTIPAAHPTVNRQALKAGKHAYCEKPFSLTYKEGLKTLKEAQKRKLRVGCAPDTVLGGGIQTCRKLIDDGAIGKPIAATANMLCHGPRKLASESGILLSAGRRPALRHGALLSDLAGDDARAGQERHGHRRRPRSRNGRSPASRSPAKRSRSTTPTHLCGVLEFGKGAVATVTMSFDVWKHHLPMLEIYGTEGSLHCPDPNGFGGEVLLWTAATKAWESVPLTHCGDAGRGMGLADMAEAIRERRPHRASGELGLHVVEIMESFLTSADAARSVALKSTCRQPAALAPGLPLGKLS